MLVTQPPGQACCPGNHTWHQVLEGILHRVRPEGGAGQRDHLPRGHALAQQHMQLFCLRQGQGSGFRARSRPKASVSQLQMQAWFLPTAMACRLLSDWLHRHFKRRCNWFSAIRSVISASRQMDRRTQPMQVSAAGAQLQGWPTACGMHNDQILLQLQSQQAACKGGLPPARGGGRPRACQG